MAKQEEHLHKQIIKECLNAVANGPFIPEWEFPVLIGVNRNEVKEIADKWPDTDLEITKTNSIINNCFNNLIGYPIEQPNKWSAYLSVTRLQLEDIFNSWRRETFGA